LTITPFLAASHESSSTHLEGDNDTLGPFGPFVGTAEGRTDTDGKDDCLIEGIPDKLGPLDGTSEGTFDRLGAPDG